MTDESPSAPMKPQETVIYLLGELKGSVQSLQQSVDATARAQADINKANEEEHAKFRTDIAALATSVAVLNDNRTSQRFSAAERTQRWMTWLGVPGALAASIALFFTHK